MTMLMTEDNMAVHNEAPIAIPATAPLNVHRQCILHKKTNIAVVQTYSHLASHDNTAARLE